MKSVMRSPWRVSAIAAVLALILTVFPTVLLDQKTVAVSAPPPRASVARSNDNAAVLLAVMARFNPESTGALGVNGLDEQITDITPGVDLRRERELNKATGVLKRKLKQEKDPLVRQDLEILLQAAIAEIRGSQLRQKYEIPYINVSQLVFGGLQALLDEQVPPERRQSALIRLKRYTGMEPGYQPITLLASQQTRQKLNRSGLMAPIKAQVEKDLANNNVLIAVIAQLFEQFKIAGYQEPYAKLKQQLAAYDAFVRQEVLPLARTDFKLPPQLYAFALEQIGVDIPPAELAARAHAAFNSFQQQLQAIAPQVAQQKQLKSTDYRDVIRALKQEQLSGKDIIPHYQQRIKQIESIIRRENIVTLPQRPMRFRLASAAESVNVPAPQFKPPRLLGNTGQIGEFVLPLSIPASDNSKAEAPQKLDDFTFAAASWTLTAHEGRPGHELQFATMIEKGVSAARAVFAFNSVNVEGWALYCESIMKPYMPVEGQLIGLQFQLLRAARAFLDPELQMGKITPEQALRVLKEDVVFSDAFANSEVERYTFWAPGQATSYFLGLTRLQELRTEVEQKMGAKFDRHKYHDFILSQGLLPPDLLRRAVMEDFAKIS